MKEGYIDKIKATKYLEYLNRKYDEWYIHPNKKYRDGIENEVQSMAMCWDDTIYMWLNEGKATGLFEPGFFETDMLRAMRMLREVVK